MIDRPVASLRPRSHNPRTHSRRQIRQIAGSIREFGFTNPVLVDADERIVAGHGRVEAAKLLGIDRVPTIRLEDLSEAQIRAYVIADNRLAEIAGWDPELLAIELQFLAELEPEFDVTVTGFETGEIDLLIREHDTGRADPEDIVDEPDPAAPVVSRPGDLWLLGRHRLFCGDAREPGAFKTLMDGKRAQMVFTDPPYNVPIDGHVCGSGSIRHREFMMASGEMTETEFVAFLERILGNLANSSADGSIHYVCMDWRHAHALLTAGRAVYSDLKNLCVWVKDNGGMGSLYRSRHELVFVFKNGSAPHINNVELGRHGRYRTNVWTCPGINSLHADRLEELRLHPTVKPVAMVADAVLDCSKRNGLVLDAFAGSGTTLIAAERTGRRGCAMEIDPRYVDTAIRRWRDYASADAIHAETGVSFAEAEAAVSDGATEDSLHGSREGTDAG